MRDCYHLENETLKRYEVFVKREKLDNLRIEIINNCSLIKHFEGKIRGSDRVDPFDLYHYRNVNEEYIGEAECKDFYPLSTSYYELYEVSYDEYFYPDIITIINKVLETDLESSYYQIDGNLAKKILNYQVDEEKEIFPVFLEQIKDILAVDNLENPSAIRKCLKSAEDFLDFYELNKDQKPVSLYLKDLKSCFDFHLKEEIPHSLFTQVYDFLDTDAKEMIENNFSGIVNTDTPKSLKK